MRWEKVQEKWRNDNSILILIPQNLFCTNLESNLTEMRMFVLLIP